MKRRNRRLVGLVCFMVGTVVAGGGPTRAQSGALPSPWIAQDIGTPAIAGSSSFDQATGTFATTAAGADIWGTSDQFRFIYQPLAGDAVITARVDALSFADPWSKAGVMIRSSLSANAAHALALVSAGNGAAFQRRRTAGGSSVHTAGSSTAAAPLWVRLARSGSNVTASTSSDGSSWTTIGTDTIALGATAYVGIAMTSHNVALAASAQISSVTATVVGGLPSPQQSQDIGSPAVAGSATFSQGTYTVTAAGRDIGANADQFHYVYQPVAGDLNVTVRVGSLIGANQLAKAGVMIRENLTPGSAHAFAGLATDQGYVFDRRPTAGGSTVQSTAVAGATPGWVRLIRAGDLITAYRSLDGVTWTLIGSDSFPMTAAVYVGIAVTSRNVAATTTAAVTNLVINQTPSNQRPVVTLTSPANGATFTSPASVAMTATATDADGTIARVDFYNGTTLLGTDATAPYTFTWGSVAAGTYTVNAVAVDNAGATGSSATATITVSAATTGLFGAYGLNEGSGSSAADSSGRSAAGVITGATWVAGRYGQALSFDGNDAVLLADPGLTGSFTVMGWLQTRSLYTNGCGSFLMKTSDYGIEICAGTLMASVGSGTAFTATVRQTWTNADLNTWKHVAMTYDGTTVRLYVGGVLAGSGTGTHQSNGNPLTVGRWSTPAVEYWNGLIDEVRLYNRALTLADIQTDRDTPIVGGSANQAPTVTLTAPSGGETLIAPASIGLTANAADADGTVARVEFYNGAALLGSDTTAPYALTWAGIAAGSYAIRAVAYDNAGASTSSATVTITVTAPVSPPTAVVFLASADHASGVTNYLIEIFTAAADPATATPVASSDMGKPTPAANGDITVDLAGFFSALAPGAYQLTISAIGPGGTSSSPAVAFTR
jgi:regulation of enolase protein 1 (concanavalin A-like superfamily)